MYKFFYKTYFLFIFIVFLFSPIISFAEMRSSNYIIYENLLHTFNGPSISSVSALSSENTATVTWATDLPSNSYVVYDDNNSFTSSLEQGNGVELLTSHTVTLVGLDYASTYFFRVKSKTANGDETLGSIASFTTGAAPAEPSSGGGGIIVIDKTDKIPPIITEVEIAGVTKDQASISWVTDEEATSFVEYGKDRSYGKIAGTWDYLSEHVVILRDLDSNAEYNFRVLSSDDSGNVSYSGNLSFTTLIDEGSMIDTDDDGVPDTVIDQEDLDSVLKKAVEIMDSMAGTVSTEVIRDKLETPYDYLNRLADYVPAPIFNADPRVEINAKDATLYWRTNVDSSGLVSFATEEEYNPSLDNPYTRTIGDPDLLTTEHEVELFGLEPNTTYHYQLKSKAKIGPLAVTADYTFKTNIETIEISNFFSQVMDDNTAVFKWITNKPANSTVRYTPYRGDYLSPEEEKELRDNNQTVIHEITISEFQPGINYLVNIESEDVNGNIATETIDPFSTSEDDYPPIISQVKTNSSISSDRDAKIQTVISWNTNEPATTRVFYMEGVHGPNVELTGTTAKSNDYSKEHVTLFTEFTPGTVYTFRLESIDSGGNETISDPQTFMTPKKNESIVDVIIRVLEDTFGWVKTIMR